MNLNIMEPLAELDGFEPQTRARSNTWPLPRPENYVEPGEEAGNKCVGLPVPTPSSAPAKKNSSRRNAWGNLSYADLITQAITSSPDKRLTLSQIYEWMVQNVPYFKDKGDSNSSAGWKVGVCIPSLFLGDLVSTVDLGGHVALLLVKKGVNCSFHAVHGTINDVLALARSRGNCLLAAIFRDSLAMGIGNMF